MSHPWVGPASAAVEPPGAARGNDAFRRLLPALCVVGGVTHVGFLVLFLVAGVPILAAANVLSIGCYVAVFELIRRGRTNNIVEFSLLAGEIFAHAVLATLILGWDSGFHYYLLLAVPVIAVSSMRPPWLKTVGVAAAGFAYLALDLWLRSAVPPRLLVETSLQLLYYFNLLTALLILAGLAARYHLLIQQTQAALRTMATTDPLTRLPNRQSLGEFIGAQHSRAQRGHAMSFIMCDVDHFKLVNDRRGHAAGDDVLRAVSGSMAAGVRVTDVVGRWGGEEFLVVLPDAEAAEAAQVAERVRAGVACLPVFVGGELTRVTVTLGVSTLGTGEAASWAVARADAAMYEGKRAGRNRVVVAAGPTHDHRVASTAR